MVTPTPTTVQVKIQLRSDTSANWASVNPVLLAGEMGLETNTNRIKIGNGSTAWNSLGYFPFVISGGTVTGNLEIGTTGTLTFEGSSADNFETTLGVINPTADRTINLPNVSGTIITTGDTGTVTSTMIADGTIVDADVSATAEIAVSKLADGAARQLLQTDAAGTGVEWTSNVDIPGTLDVTGAATFDGAVTVAGDLTVNGTTTNINTQNLVVEDKNIILGDVATPTDVTADGGGITLKGATDKTINWVDATDAWTSSERFSVPLGSAASPSLTFTGDENSGVYSPGSDQVAIATGGTGRLFVDANGRVLINGATARTNILTTNTVGFQLEGTSFDTSNIVSIRNSSDVGSANLILGKTRGSTVGSTTIVQSGDQLGVIRFTGSDGTTFLAGSTIQSHADGTMGTGVMPGYLAFSTTPTGSGGPSERLRITSAGLVGVGVSSPQLPLTIGLGGGANPATSGSTQSSGGIARIGSSGAAALDIGTLAAGPVWLQSTNVTNLATNYSLLLNPNGGNVGIGTTSPSGLLHLQGASIAESWYTATNAGGATWRVGTADTSSGLSGAYRIYDSTNSVTRLLINSSGYVGIDTAAPETNLDVKGSGTRMIRCITTNTSGTAVGIVRAEYLGGGGGVNASAELRAGDGYTYLVNTTNSPLLIGTAGTERARIDSSGNLGIGSSSPQAVLHVERNQAAESGIFINNPNAGGYVAVRFGNSDRGTNGDHLVYGGTVLGLRSKTGTGITFEPAGSEKARLDSSGRLLVGTSSARGNYADIPQIQLEGTDNNNSSAQLLRNSNNGGGATLYLGKTRGTSIGGTTVVANGDDIGNIRWVASDGTSLLGAASITASVDGTPSANDMPGRLVFSTTADGASSPTERMRITQAGFTKLSNAGTYYDSTGGYHEARTTTNDASIIITATNATYTKEALRIFVTKSANTDWWFADYWSGTTTDKEFGFRGDGQAYADGSWNGGGADYAEYFEWSDSNPNAEDRRGISVVLDGDKIREAQPGEDPIGVISGNPSVVGDAAWNKWSGKYLRDEFGTYIQEDYEVTDDDGNTVTQQRRKLNPAYDPDVEYVSREERPEWDCVGLMGKLRIRKGQATGSRWIKMRDISDSVEEWLVR